MNANENKLPNDVVAKEDEQLVSKDFESLYKEYGSSKSLELNTEYQGQIFVNPDAFLK